MELKVSINNNRIVRGKHLDLLATWIARSPPNSS